MAMPGSLKENILILFTIPTCLPKRKSIFRDAYCQCISRARTSKRENREARITKHNVKTTIPKGSIRGGLRMPCTGRPDLKL